MKGGTLYVLVGGISCYGSGTLCYGVCTLWYGGTLFSVGDT